MKRRCVVGGARSGDGLQNVAHSHILHGTGVCFSSFLLFQFFALVRHDGDDGRKWKYK